MVPVTTHRVDARNLMCPLPVIRTQQKIETYLAGALGGDKPTHTM